MTVSRFGDAGVQRVRAVYEGPALRVDLRIGNGQVEPMWALDETWHVGVDAVGWAVEVLPARVPFKDGDVVGYSNHQFAIREAGGIWKVFVFTHVSDCNYTDDQMAGDIADGRAWLVDLSRPLVAGEG